MLAEVARVLAEHQISISSVIQHEALDGREGETGAAGHHDAHRRDRPVPRRRRNDRPAAVRLRRGGVLLGGGLSLSRQQPAGRVAKLSANADNSNCRPDPARSETLVTDAESYRAILRRELPILAARYGVASPGLFGSFVRRKMDRTAIWTFWCRLTTRPDCYGSCSWSIT